MIQEIVHLGPRGDEEESSNQTGRQTIRPAKERGALCSLPSRVGKVGSGMEIRMAYPNEIQRIMEIIQDAKESPGSKTGRSAAGWLSR